MAKPHFQAEFKLEVSGRKKQEGYTDQTETESYRHTNKMLMKEQKRVKGFEKKTCVTTGLHYILN